MKVRLFALALLFALVAVLLTALTLWPLGRPLFHWAMNGGTPPAAGELFARARSVFFPLLILEGVSCAVIGYLLLDATVGRPLRKTEEALEQLEHLQFELPLNEAHSGGALLSRVRGSLRRLVEALRQEQRITHQQLDELRSANERLSRARDELVRSEQLAVVGRLAAGVAHEVGNPLMGILGYLSIMKDRPSATPEVKEYVGRIEDEVQRIDRIVRGLLDLGRPPKANREPMLVAGVVESCIGLLRSGRDFSGLMLEAQVPPELSAMTDRTLLSQILVNLLLNAAQAMGGKGRIAIIGAKEASGVSLRVEDTGPGLSDEVRQKLFEPFFTTKQGQGTGLGLAVSRQLAEALGGKLTAENRAEGGARFTVTLPSATALD